MLDFMRLVLYKCTQKKTIRSQNCLLSEKVLKFVYSQNSKQYGLTQYAFEAATATMFNLCDKEHKPSELKFNIPNCPNVSSTQ